MTYSHFLLFPTALYRVLHLHSTIQCHPAISFSLSFFLTFCLSLFWIIWGGCVSSLIMSVLVVTFHCDWKLLAFLLYQTPQSLITTLQDGWNSSNHCPSIHGTKQVVVRVLRRRILARHASLWAMILISFVLSYYPYATYYNFDHACPNNNFIEMQSGLSFYSWSKN